MKSVQIKYLKCQNVEQQWKELISSEKKKYLQPLFEIESSEK